MTIDSHHLRIFCSLAHHLNMSRAAEELGLTPSGISHALKALELDLGCRLFERTPRKISLSAAGAQFVAEAKEILLRMSRARAKLRSWNDWRRGRLQLAASTTACQYILPQALREFRPSFPEFTIGIEPCGTARALEGLADGSVDLAFTIKPAQHSGADFLSASEDELQFVVHPLHPWVAKRRAIPEEIQQQNLILPESGSETHALIEAYFRRQGIRIAPFIEIGNEEAIKQFIQLDLGIGFLPSWIVAAELKQGMLAPLPLGRRRLRRNWGILHTKQRQLSLAESVFIDLCRDVSRRLMARGGE